MDKMKRQGISRRDLLKGAGAGSAALVLGQLLEGGVAPAYAGGGLTKSGCSVLIDLTRCAGCNSCALACKQSNELDCPDVIPQGLDTDAYTFVEKCQVDGDDPDGKTLSVKRQCMHCVHPACVSVCTVGALHKTEQGPVVYDAEKCIGCRYCQYACPFGVPTYEWENPLGLISKCQFCFPRLSQGEVPACAAACPTGALRFGQRNSLLAQAHAQIGSNPGRYVDHVYGEHEAGGTSMLYLSPLPFDQLGFPQVGADPVPLRAEAVMKQTPTIALTVASVVTGLSWAIKRRDGFETVEEE